MHSSPRQAAGYSAKDFDKIDMGGIIPEEKRAIDAFHKALKRKQAGKADDDWRHDDED